MNRERFIALVKNPALLDAKDAPFLEELLSEFPYFQTAHLLAARCYKVNDSIHLQKQIKKAAAHIIDRKVLYNLIENFQVLEEQTKNKIDLNQNTEQSNNTLADLNVTKEPVFTENEKLDSAVENDLQEHFEQNELKSKTEIIEVGIKNSELPESIINENEVSNEDNKFVIEEKKDELVVEATQTVEDKVIFDAEVPLEREIKLALAESLYLHELEQNLLDIEIKSSENEQIISPIEEESAKVEEEIEAQINKTEENKVQTTDFVAWLKNLKINTPIVEKVVAKPNKEGEKLIDAFMEKPIQRAKPIKQEFYSPVNMAKQSVSDNDFFVTETLAKIYIKQGNLAKAIKVYQNLSLKNPEKNNIFAAQIKILKEQLHNKTGK
jgi:hypothetical protein